MPIMMRNTALDTARPDLMHQTATSTGAGTIRTNVRPDADYGIIWLYCMKVKQTTGAAADVTISIRDGINSYTIETISNLANNTFQNVDFQPDVYMSLPLPCGRDTYVSAAVTATGADQTVQIVALVQRIGA